jgi:membrane protease YdiL (CAAX protease family)
MVIGDDARFPLEASTVALIPPALVAGLLIGSLQEELGWRRFVLPRLIARWRSVRAAFALGARGVRAGGGHLSLAPA